MTDLDRDRAMFKQMQAEDPSLAHGMREVITNEFETVRRFRFTHERPSDPFLAQAMETFGATSYAAISGDRKAPLPQPSNVSPHGFEYHPPFVGAKGSDS